MPKDGTKKPTKRKYVRRKLSEKEQPMPPTETSESGPTRLSVNLAPLPVAAEPVITPAMEAHPPEDPFARYEPLAGEFLQVKAGKVRAHLDQALENFRRREGDGIAWDLTAREFRVAEKLIDDEITDFAASRVSLGTITWPERRALMALCKRRAFQIVAAFREECPLS